MERNLFADASLYSPPGGQKFDQLPAGWAYYLEADEPIVGSGSMFSTANINTVECLAVMNGLEKTDEGDSITICSDSLTAMTAVFSMTDFDQRERMFRTMTMDSPLSSLLVGRNRKHKFEESKLLEGFGSDMVDRWRSVVRSRSLTLSKVRSMKGEKDQGAPHCICNDAANREMRSLVDMVLGMQRRQGAKK